MPKVIPLYPETAAGTIQESRPPIPWSGSPDDLVAVISSALSNLLPTAPDSGIQKKSKLDPRKRRGAFYRLEIELYWPTQAPGRIIPLSNHLQVSNR